MSFGISALIIFLAAPGRLLAWSAAFALHYPDAAGSSYVHHASLYIKNIMPIGA
jgi:hypothetical protein